MLNTKLFDHTILKADATEAQVAKICDEALAHDFASVCVNQYYTKFVAEKLKGSDVKVCTVVGFPLGMSDTRVKAFETRAAIEDGAQEVDMVHQRRSPQRRQIRLRTLRYPDLKRSMRQGHRSESHHRDLPFNR